MNDDSKNRARELSDSLKEAFARRDELQRQMKDIRGNLEVAIAQRDKLQTSASQDESLATSLEEKDARIQKLGKELDNWQKRVPPLVERYRERDLEAQQLEVELQKAQDHIATLEGMTRGEHTSIEPVDSSTIPDGLDASNEPHTSTSILDPVDLEADEYEDLEDQVDETVDETEDKPSPVELLSKNGFAYYAYLPSAVIDGDLDLANQRMQWSAEGGALWMLSELLETLSRWPRARPRAARW